MKTTFSRDYFTARQRFREAANQLGWHLEALPIDQVGPNGEQLTIDVACSTTQDTDDVLVVSSGIHGVEGFFGSAVQLAMLRQWKQKAAPKIKIVFIHALNPYGMAWLRRVNEDNVDPNRNFLLPGDSFAGADKNYALMDNILNPKRPPNFWQSFYPKVMWLIARHGLPAFKQAVASGQYEFPHGLFFGGKGPCRSQQLLLENMPRWLKGNKRVVHIDFHTGLGKYASWKHLLDSPLTPSQQQWLDQYQGSNSYELCHAEGIAYESRGDLGRWCVAHQFSPDYLFLCTEFGAYNEVKILHGLREENRAHLWGDPKSLAAIAAKKRLKQLFCPRSKKWRRAVLNEGMMIVKQAVQGLEE